MDPEDALDEQPGDLEVSRVERRLRRGRASRNVSLLCLAASLLRFVGVPEDPTVVLGLIGFTGFLLSIPVIESAKSELRSVGKHRQLVVLLRHAEVEENSPGLLSDAGRRRADELVTALSHLPISKIHVDGIAPCRATVEPIAERLRIEPTVIGSFDHERHRAEIRTSRAGSAVLICAPADSIPLLLRELGAPPPALPPGPVPDDAYDFLAVLVLPDGIDGDPTRAHVRFETYGDESAAEYSASEPWQPLPRDDDGIHPPPPIR